MTLNEEKLKINESPTAGNAFFSSLKSFNRGDGPMGLDYSFKGVLHFDEDGGLIRNRKTVNPFFVKILDYTSHNATW